MGDWLPSLGVVALQAAADTALFVAGYDGEVAICTSVEAVTWPAVESGEVHASNQPVLEVAGACVIYGIALYPTSEGGDFPDDTLAFFDIDGGLEFTEAGTYTLTDIALSITVWAD